MNNQQANPHYSLVYGGIVLVGLCLSGCNAAIWGNMLVLGVTVGIFFGTLALGRTSTPRSGDSATSTSSSSQV